MLHFECDYACGAAKVVLDALCETNAEAAVGYGEDEYCRRAKELILEQCGGADAEVHFVVGGTQANMTVIAAALRPYEGVLCADTGHINAHETGAVEATGHKVLALPGKDGKISAAQVERAVKAQRADASHEHIVSPAMVYISHPTELGTLYTREELTRMYEVCRELGVLLFVDGARLGYGIAAGPEVDMPFLSRHSDAFTIGGTKVGLLFGEAIVLCGARLRDHFRYHIKQRGGMLAKGRLLGLQFDAILRGGAYLSLAAAANALAQDIKRSLLALGFPMAWDTPTNQIFPVLPDRLLNALADKVCFSYWQRADETHSVVRICTSALSTREEADALIGLIREALRTQA